MVLNITFPVLKLLYQPKRINKDKKKTHRRIQEEKGKFPSVLKSTFFSLLPGTLISWDVTGSIGLILYSPRHMRIH